MEVGLGLTYLGAGFGSGLAIIGGGIGIGIAVAAALQGLARQPEVEGKLRTLMLIGAALIEGLSFFALVICFMLVMKTSAAEGKTETGAKPPASAPSH